MTSRPINRRAILAAPAFFAGHASGLRCDPGDRGTIKCPCHGSAFRIADGSVATGPAARPLPAAGVTLDGDTIRLT